MNGSTIYDFIIVCGGSAGSVLANRLYARSANQVLLCEAGEDTQHGKVPEAILDSYPGAAAIDKRLQWVGLKASTEVVSHNAPARSKSPPAAGVHPGPRPRWRFVDQWPARQSRRTG